MAAALRPVTDDLVLVANDADAATWLLGVRLVSDVLPGTGGLAGVHAALAPETDALVVAWDMPFVTPELLAAIRDCGAVSGAEVCVPESVSPYGMEPFCAYYSGRVRARLDDFLRSGGGAAREFLAQCAVERLPLAEVRRHGEPALLFLNVNTPDDLERARAAALMQ